MDAKSVVFVCSCSFFFWSLAFARVPAGDGVGIVFASLLVSDLFVVIESNGDMACELIGPISCRCL